MKNSPRQFEQSNSVTLGTFVTFRVNFAKGLSRWAARCFVALSMIGLNLSIDEELLSSFEPRLNIERVRV